MTIDLLSDYEKIYVWGTGNYLKIYSKYLPDRIDGYIDNDIRKSEQLINGKSVHIPEYLKEENEKSTLIIICTCYFDEIVNQIQELGDFASIYIEDMVMLIDSVSPEKRYVSLRYLSNVDINIKQTVLSIAGMNALFQTNGCRKFIKANVS